jgi:2-oxoglutarate ferredoxin oxidoreductase subunit alpha
MTVLRQQKVDRIADRLDPVEVDDPDGDGQLLIVGWGSTDGPIRAAVHTLREDGRKVAHLQLRHLSPLRRGVDEAVKRYPTVLCAEANLGQLTRLLRARTLVDVQGHHRVTGLPFTSVELVARATELLDQES